MTDQTSSENQLWTPANIVTLIRICGIPVFVVALISPWPAWFGWDAAAIWKEWIAAGIFILLAATDGLDGYLARSRNEVTNFGKFMDPLADKILVAAALLALIELGVLPSWVALIILCREFIVSGIRMVAATQGVVIAASWYGKAKTVVQIIALVLFIIKDSHMLSNFSDVLNDRFYLFSWGVMIIALILTIVSMLDYFAKARSLLGFGKSSSASVDKDDLESTEDIADIASFDTLVQQILSAARKKGKLIGTAESCTGGLIAASLTAVAGSSDVVAGSIVSYSNDVKESRLLVHDETLERFGAVSGETAREMAQGAKEALDVDVAVSVTGIAGPGGGTPDKPVGTVWIGLASALGTQARLFHFEGNRAQVRLQTVYEALLMIEKSL